MPSYKLTYFNAKGLAEVPRFLFAKAGVEYEDVRLDNEQFKVIKDSECSTTCNFTEPALRERNKRKE